MLALVRYSYNLDWLLLLPAVKNNVTHLCVTEGSMYMDWNEIFGLIYDIKYNLMHTPLYWNEQYLDHHRMTQ